MRIGYRFLMFMAMAITISHAARTPVVLKRVVDGDTVVVSPANNPSKVIRVRLRYIDAPEKKQKYGKEATIFLQDILSMDPTKQLQLEVHKIDLFGRTIGILHLGDDDINKLMVDNGYAWCYRNKCPENYKIGVEMSKSEKIGLFKDKNPQTPWDYRKSKKKPRTILKGIPQTTDQIISAIPTVPALGRKTQKREVRLVRVSDGDTITVETFNEGQQRVRFLYIDAPEKSQQSGQAAKNFLKTKLTGSDKTLSIRYKEKDRYGRILGVVYLGRRNINKLMVTNGLAWCYKTGCPSTYKRAMKQARQTGAGLWENDNPKAPWVYRKSKKSG